MPIQKEKEGVSAEPGGSAEGGAAGERKTSQGEPGTEGETGWEGGERSDLNKKQNHIFFPEQNDELLQKLIRMHLKELGDLLRLCSNCESCDCNASVLL